MEFDDGPIAIVDPQIDNGPVAIVDPQIDDGPVAIVDLHHSHTNNASVLIAYKTGILEGAVKLKCDQDLVGVRPMLGIVLFHRAKHT